MCLAYCNNAISTVISLSFSFEPCDFIQKDYANILKDLTLSSYKILGCLYSRDVD